MLTKIGNLLGLQNTKQSQLNLGVIQSLAGEVFNTDNCRFFENQHGITFRFPDAFRLQVCFSVIENTGLTINKPIGSGFRPDGKTLNFPSPFASPPAISAFAIYKGSSFGVNVECTSSIAALTYASIAFNSLVSIPDSSVPGIRLLAVGVY